MAYTASAIEIAFTPTGLLDGKEPVAVKAGQKRGLFRRMLGATTAARMRRAEQEVARYLATTGGKLTDEAEREIERRFFAAPERW